LKALPEADTKSFSIPPALLEKFLQEVRSPPLSLDKEVQVMQ